MSPGLSPHPFSNAAHHGTEMGIVEFLRLPEDVRNFLENGKPDGVTDEDWESLGHRYLIDKLSTDERKMLEDAFARWQEKIRN